MAKLLADALALIGGDVERSGAVLGGGTTLAARWKHRLSTDIDLFTSTEGWQAVRRSVVQALTDAGVKFALHASLVVCDLGDGRAFSIGGSDSITADPGSGGREESSGLPTQTTAEIVARKIRARMVNETRYLIRDAYDVVCCRIYDARAFKQALSALHPDEAAALQYDAGRADVALDWSQALIAPAHPGLADPGVLRTALFEALGGSLTDERLATLTPERFRPPAGPSRGRGC